MRVFFVFLTLSSHHITLTLSSGEAAYRRACPLHKRKSFRIGVFHRAFPSRNPARGRCRHEQRMAGWYDVRRM